MTTPEDTAAPGQAAVVCGRARRWQGVARNSGFFPPVDGEAALRTSFCQLCQLSASSALVAVTLFILVFNLVADDGRLDFDVRSTGAAATLFVTRTLPIFSGASPAAPILLCALIVYVWAVGRMARLRLAHGVSRLSPQGSVCALVSTPIAFILNPQASSGNGTARAVRDAESTLLNAIVRPITGANYASALAILLFLPALLFYLKPLSTLERTEGAWLLGIGLALAALLIGNTLIQLLQYWLALERLLKLILQHRLGRAFKRVAPFVRDSAAAQVSRSPHDLLRLCSCVTCLDDLVRQLEQLKEVTTRELRQQLMQRRREAIEVRDRALTLASGPNAGEAAEREAQLGRELVEASRLLVEVLTPYWDGSRDAFLQRKVREPNASATRVTWQPGRSELPPAISVVTSGQEGGGEASPELPPELLWLRDAESLVATVTTLILGRHVRQFQYFVYTLTGCALLLVAAVSTYAFEPHRLLLTWIWAVVGAIVALGLWVYLEIDRNGLLSRIAGTTPGKLTWDSALAVRIVTWVAFPLLSVAAVQYPELANQAFKFLEPFTRALH